MAARTRELCMTASATRERVYGMCRPLIVRATTNRWISDVPSKIV
jgi:hypothetical protein